MTKRWVNVRMDDSMLGRIRAAAEADRRSVSNWVALACERALDAGEAPEPESEGEAP